MAGAFHHWVVHTAKLPTPVTRRTSWASGDDLTDRLASSTRTVRTPFEPIQQRGETGARFMRQIAGSFAQYEKTRLVTKLRGARECIREASGTGQE